MAALCCTLVFALFLAARAAEPRCVVGERESQCTLSSAPQRLMLLGDRLIVGAIDSLHSFSPDLTPLDNGDISPSANRTRYCEDVEAHQPELCRNFVRVVQPVNESSLLVCGTNAFFPKCRFHQLDNLSAWEFMTPEEQRDIGFSPHSNNTNVALLTEDGRFFTATAFHFRQQQLIGMSPLLLDGQATFTVQTPSSSPEWIKEPVFISAYDVGSHVYFFAREPAYEADEVEYSRAIRVCKNDSGFVQFRGDSTLTFQTFQKARLRCRTAGQDGSIPYDYDRLQATFLLGAADGRGEPTLYGTFSSPINGPEGAALCKFNFSDINSVFEDGQYRIRISASGGWKQRSTAPFTCPGEPGPQRTEEQARDYQLVYNVGTASEPQPMHSVIGDEFTHVVVDMVEYGGSELEVMVLAQKSGIIMQLVQFGGALYRKTIKTVSNSITNILLHRHPQSEERRVILTTATSVQSFTLGRCQLYDTCFKCHDSHDPYCAWDQGKGECVNKLATDAVPATLSDSLTTSESSAVSVCGQRPTTPPPTQPPVDPSACPNTPTSTPDTSPSTTGTSGSSSSDGNSTDEPSLSPPVGLDTETKSENVGQIAGATVGGFLVGIPVGLVVCYLFFSVFLKKGSKSPEPVLQSARTLQVNHNQLAMFEKQPRFLEHAQVVHRNPTSAKNVNQDDPARDEEDDVLTELPFSKGRSYGYTQTDVQHIHQPSYQVRAMPGHQVPNGRTEPSR